MTSADVQDKLTVSLKISAPDVFTEALAIMTLGRPLPPRFLTRADMARLADDPCERQRQVLDLLAPLNLQRHSDAALGSAAAGIHVACDWASLYRQTSGMARSRSNRRVRVISWTAAGASLKAELRRALDALDHGHVIRYANRIAALSAAAFDVLLDAANMNGVRIASPPDMLNRPDMRVALATAMEAVNGRPRQPAHSASVRVICAVFAKISGHTANRSTVWAGDDAGMPTGALYELIKQIGEIYGITLTDYRIRTSPER